MNSTALRWMARALIAEGHLRMVGAPAPVDLFDADAYLAVCMEHKDGRPATVDQVQAAHRATHFRYAPDDAPLPFGMVKP